MYFDFGSIVFRGFYWVDIELANLAEESSFYYIIDYQNSMCQLNYVMTLMASPQVKGSNSLTISNRRMSRSS